MFSNVLCRITSSINGVCQIDNSRDKFRFVIQVSNGLFVNEGVSRPSWFVCNFPWVGDASIREHIFVIDPYRVPCFNRMNEGVIRFGRKVLCCFVRYSFIYARKLIIRGNGARFRNLCETFRFVCRNVCGTFSRFICFPLFRGNLSLMSGARCRGRGWCRTARRLPYRLLRRKKRECLCKYHRYLFGWEVVEVDGVRFEFRRSNKENVTSVPRSEVDLCRSSVYRFCLINLW